MCESEDWLFRPVLRGMFHADRLVDGSVDLDFVALCNEAIDVEQENAGRVSRAQAEKARLDARGGNRRSGR